VIEVGTRVRPAEGVPRTGQLGVVRELHVINGMRWADVEFQTPHAFHGGRFERIGVDWLVEAPS
jgi:hypothetical protein